MKTLLELVEDPVSLETPVGDGESLYGDLIEDTKTDRPDTVTAGHHLRSAELGVALQRLAPRMRHVLSRRFDLDGEPPKPLKRSAPTWHHPRALTGSSSTRSPSPVRWLPRFSSTSAPSS